MLKFYHGTDISSAEDILAEGLKGGYNERGGTHGEWDIPTLFITPHRHVARKYGTILEITLTETEIDEFERLIDGLGDECFTKEGKGVLITSDKIKCPEVDELYPVPKEDPRILEFEKQEEQFLEKEFLKERKKQRERDRKERKW